MTVINEKAVSQGVAVHLIASEAGRFPHLEKAGKRGKSALNLRNFQVWSKKLGWKQGLKTIDASKRNELLPRYSTNRRQRFGTPEFWKLFGRLYMSQSKMSFPVAYNTACDLYLAQTGRRREDMPTLDQVRYYYDNHVAKVAIMEARHGKEYIINNVLSYAERDWSGVNPGDCFIGDHRKLDCAIRTWNEKEQKWESKRPWMTAWMDAKSLKFVGILIRVVDYPNGVAIEDSLISAIRANKNIPPKFLYMDNGQDYRAQGFSQPITIGDCELSICKELSIKPQFSMPYNGRAKTIERMFKELAGGIDKACKGYLGNRPGARPEWAQQIWKNPEVLPNLQEFSEFSAAWLKQVYNKTIGKNSKITGGLSPDEVWNNRKIDYSRQLSDRDLYFATLRPLKSTRKVGRGAAVTVTMKERGIKQGRYECAELWKHFGKEVIIKIDVFDANRVWAFDLQGRLIGECHRIMPVPALASTPEQKQLVAAQINKQKHQAIAIRELVALETGQIEVSVPQVREQLAAASRGESVLEVKPVVQQIADKSLNMDEREDIKQLMDSERPSAPVLTNEDKQFQEFRFGQEAKNNNTDFDTSDFEESKSKVDPIDFYKLTKHENKDDVW